MRIRKSRWPITLCHARGKCCNGVASFRKTLQLAQELSDRAVEAQACYSLGNTYTLLRDYPMAIHYHLRHLAIAQELNDKVGEGRACWSLGNAYSATNAHEKALQYANRHLDISKEVWNGFICWKFLCSINMCILITVFSFFFLVGHTPISEVITCIPELKTEPKVSCLNSDTLNCFASGWFKH